MANISQIKVGTTTYDINATTLAGKTLEEILTSGNTAVFTLSDSAEKTPNITNFNNGSISTSGLLTPDRANGNSIYLVAVYEEGSIIYYNEYVVISGAWALLGTTDIDLAGYVRDGAYQSELASSTTDEYAGENVVTNIHEEYKAGGEVSVKYYKATNTGAPEGKISEPR